MIIKLNIERRAQVMSGYSGPCTVTVDPTSAYKGILSIPETASLTMISRSGKDAGEVTEGLIIPPNKVVEINLGTFHTRSGQQLFVSPSLELLRVADVSGTFHVTPDRAHDIVLIIKARNEVRLAELQPLLQFVINGG